MRARRRAGQMQTMTSPHIYIDCDVPEGMTLCEWRRSQCTGRRPLWRHLLRR